MDAYEMNDASADTGWVEPEQVTVDPDCWSEVDVPQVEPEPIESAVGTIEETTWEDPAEEARWDDPIDPAVDDAVGPAGESLDTAGIEAPAPWQTEPGPDPSDTGTVGTFSTDAPEPVVYEVGTLVTQEPLAPDVVTVDDITGTEAYQSYATGSTGPIQADGLVDTSGGFDGPSAFASPTMVGDAGDSAFWFQQNSQNSCGPSVVAQIVSDFTGVHHADEVAIENRALQMRSTVIDGAAYRPESGMFPDDLAALLTDQGVPSTVVRNQDFSHVEHFLREGRSVVMFLDARDVVPGGYEQFAAQDEVENSTADTVDHFVRVIGIDRAAGIAVLANPGIEGAAQFEIPLDRLEDAWNDVTGTQGGTPVRDKMLIVSDGADPTPDSVVPQTVGTPTGQTPGTIELPTPPTGTPAPPAGPLGTPEPTLPEPTLPEPTLPEPTLPEPTVADLPTPEHESRPVGLASADAPAPVDVVGRQVDGPSRSGSVTLPADSDSFRTTSAPASPAPIALPTDAAPAPLVDAPAAGAPDANGDGIDFTSPLGFAIIPVTLAAAGIGMAVQQARQARR
jgi:hypothetical protein